VAQSLRTKDRKVEHLLWKNILGAEGAVQQKILDDHIETGYVGLYTYVPATFEYADAWQENPNRFSVRHGCYWSVLRNGGVDKYGSDDQEK
jgi:hypothetical protein